MNPLKKRATEIKRMCWELPFLPDSEAHSKCIEIGEAIQSIIDDDEKEHFEIMNAWEKRHKCESRHFARTLADDEWEYNWGHLIDAQDAITFLIEDYEGEASPALTGKLSLRMKEVIIALDQYIGFRGPR